MSRRDFRLYKNSRRDVNKLLEKTEQIVDTKNNFSKDEREYDVRRVNGNFFAVVRFLPSVTEMPPIVPVYSHGFKNPDTNRWLIEKCPTTIKKGRVCPVCISNRDYFSENSATYKALGGAEAKKRGSARSRKLRYYSCIYVISDPKNPEREGKIFIFPYGTKIKDKIYSVMKLSEDEIRSGKKPIDVFDLFKGANFCLKVSTKIDNDGNKWPDYSECYFENSTPLFKDETKIEDIYNRIYELDEYHNPKSFLSYEDLEKKLQDVDNTDLSNISNYSKNIEENESKSNATEKDYEKFEDNSNKDESSEKEIEKIIEEDTPNDISEEIDQTDVNDYFNNL